MVIREILDQIASDYQDHQETIYVLVCNYYWPKIKYKVHHYIRNCHTCRRTKAPRNRYNGILKSLPIPTRPWTNVIPDFLTGLSLSNGYNVVLMVIDQLTKERCYISCATNENGITAKATTYLLFNTMSGNSIIFLYYLYQIEAFNLFQESRKIFARFWVLKLIYLQYFN